MILPKDLLDSLEKGNRMEEFILKDENFVPDHIVPDTWRSLLNMSNDIGAAAALNRDSLFASAVVNQYQNQHMDNLRRIVPGGVFY